MPKQNTSPAAYPQAVLQEIERLAQNIVVARKRRGETQLQWARKLGVSQPTMARIERGDPSVAMASYVMCLWLINPTVGLADLVSPENDHAALEREVNKVRQKLRPYAPAAAQTGARALAALPRRAPGTPGQRHPAAEGLAALMAASPKQPR
ncbi:MAG: XRE family transcriptional regulator [Hydrogenophaga sp.]|uniref:helix-turn-helix transcriptional regulator n=1 Tax=Hydrogenophaga sp. TaxID=1904254 RepID=UPI0025BAB616|nr:XRE family transcriptional regulator [Hydrogenophaga sp.]MBT9553935.1 XRE family transcriptional regulator [Hydrogenophaga sp.]